MEKILDRIRKLLRLARHKATNPNEAAQAAAEAQRLAFQYKLDESELILDDSEADKDSPIVEEDLRDITEPRLRGTANWQRVLIYAIAKANGCICIKDTTSRPHVMRITGRKRDVQTCGYIFAYLKSEVERLAKREPIPPHSYDTERRFRAAFRFGCAQTIAERLIALRGEMVAGLGERALVKVNLDLARIEDFFKQMHPSVVNRKIMGSGGMGYFAGQRAGKHVHLGRATAELGEAPRQLKGLN